MGGSIEDGIRQLQGLKDEIATMSQQTDNPYLGLRPTFHRFASFGGADVLAHQAITQQGYATNEAGQFLFENGVIADPNAAQVYFPPLGTGVDPADIPGSTQWLLKIQNEWTDKKANQWRKTLFNQGYDVGESGGMAHDLLTALSTYHQNRYLNGGKVQPLVPIGKETAAAVRKSFDPVMVKEQVKSWGQVPFEEDLDDHTASYFADRTIQLAVQLAKHHKDWTLDQVQQGAEVRAQKEFLEQPGVKSSIQDAEDDEMSTKIRDSVVSIAQLGGIS